MTKSVILAFFQIFIPVLSGVYGLFMILTFGLWIGMVSLFPVAFLIYLVVPRIDAWATKSS